LNHDEVMLDKDDKKFILGSIKEAVGEAVGQLASAMVRGFAETASKAD
jgi:hypothetical protein